MKSLKFVPLATFCAISVAVSSCDDWGREDPPAGNQIYPTLENVASFGFNEEEGLDPAVFTLHANPGGMEPVIIDDIDRGSVLELNNGYVSTSNPLNKVVLQNAASFTFWLKQPEIVYVLADDDEEVAHGPMSTFILDSPVISLSSESGDEVLFITPGGKLSFTSSEGSWSRTSMDNSELTAGEWHYFAAIAGDKGFELYIDGEPAVSDFPADFDFKKIVEFANSAPILSLGSASTEGNILLDDVTIYRNTITAKEIARPANGSGGGGGSDADNWILLGEEDNSTGFWSTWADYLNLTGDGTIHYEFYNYNGGTTANWCNWALVLTNGLERGAPGYSEYLYLRADAWGWASSWDVGTIEHDFIWDDNLFNIEMDGAYVTVDIIRKGTKVTVNANVQTSTGGTRYETFTADNITTDVLGTFLTCEGSHLLINGNEVFVGQEYNSGENILGATDFTTGWWSVHSPNNKFTGPFSNWAVEFVNHNAGNGGNWNNWLLVCTNGTWIGENGYAEYFVLRSDAWGWGATFDAGNTTMEQSFNWDTYVADMKDCKVKLLFSYDGDMLKMVCHQTKADGEEMPVYKFTSAGMPAPIGLFFTVELAWLDFSRIGYYPWAIAE
ncbi:MAG: hypothetical protein J1E95_04945 [Muribaculaceae bacterium]|nr:hypothetical protein [Muribaculaceae bacterium]